MRWSRVVRLVRRHWIVLVPGLVAFGLAVYQLSQPNVLRGVHGFTGAGYDDGVYFGTAVRLVHGVLPWRDFTFLHPPGLPLLFTPIALMARVIGEDNGLVVARLLTTLVVGASASLAALAVRHHGRTAALVAGMAFASFPTATASNHTAVLDPYLVFFVLLGVALAFRNGELATGRRLFAASVVFGFSGAVRAWAIFAVVPFVACVAWRERARLRTAVAGIAAGFVVPCLPFFLLAPQEFMDNVVVAQLTRATADVARLGFTDRLAVMLGFRAFDDPANATAAAVVAIIAATVVVFVFAVLRMRKRPLDWYVLGAAAVVMAGMYIPVEFYEGYAYLTAAFLAMLAGISAAHIGRALRTTSLPEPAVRSAIPVALAVAVLFALPASVRFGRDFLEPSLDQSEAIAATIPEGACAITTEPVLLVTADRWTSDDDDCPEFVDPFGLWLTQGARLPPHLRPTATPAFSATWRDWFERAEFVVLAVQVSNYVPWTNELLRWFNDNYRLVSAQEHAFVYRQQPLTPAELVARGQAEQAAGQPDAARLSFQRALQLDPRNVAAVFGLGVLEEQAGNVDAARGRYRDALGIDPTYAPARAKLEPQGAP